MNIKKWLYKIYFDFCLSSVNYLIFFNNSFGGIIRWQNRIIHFIIILIWAFLIVEPTGHRQLPSPALLKSRRGFKNKREEPISSSLLWQRCFNTIICLSKFSILTPPFSLRIYYLHYLTLLRLIRRIKKINKCWTRYKTNFYNKTCSSPTSYIFMQSLKILR